MTERKFLSTAKTEADVRKIAEWYGWQAEEDNEGQIIIYTDIPEGAPQGSPKVSPEFPESVLKSFRKVSKLFQKRF